MDSVDLATAFENLLAQPSYVVEVETEQLPAIASAIPQADESVMMRLEAVDDDRHLTIMTDAGTTILEFWLVDDEITVEFGIGPMLIEDADALGLSEDIVRQLINAPEELVSVLADDSADWEMTGDDEVNGFTTSVQEASYETTGVSDTIYFNADDVTVDARMWVEQEELFLVRLEADVSDGSADRDGTPESGSPTSGASSDTRIVLDVLSVGDVDEIDAPTSN